MRFVRQFGMVLFFSFLGEILHAVIPAGIPASIYGMLLLFMALALHMIKPDQVEETGGFLTGLLPLLFVSPVVNLLDCWSEVSPALFSILAIIVVSTLVTFGISGWATQWILKRREGGNND